MTQRSLIAETFAVSDRVKNGRTVTDVLTHATTELGELAQEVIIAEGRSYKDEGKDGIVGEAIDLMLCAIDIIRVARPDLTEAQIQDIARPKLAKWEEKAYRPKLTMQRVDPSNGGLFSGSWIVTDQDHMVLDYGVDRKEMATKYPETRIIDEVVTCLDTTITNGKIHAIPASDPARQRAS